MISTTEPLVDAAEGGGLACSTQTKIVTPKTVATPLDFCLCAARCSYVELALSSDDGDAFKNDTSSFLIDMIDVSGTFEFFLEKNGALFPLLDNTYGTFYGFGSLAQANKVGYIVDWKKVATVLGYGEYIFKATITEFGETFEQESHIFKATQYSDIRADGTVRLKSINSGDTQNGVNYTGLNWPRSIRIPATLVERAPEFEKLEGLDSLRRPVQIQDSTRDTWGLQTGFIPGSVYELLKSDLLARQVSVDNYALYQFREVRAKQMYLDEIEELDTDFSQIVFGRLSVVLKNPAIQLKRNL